MICLRCLEDDDNCFYEGICRRCISFRYILEDERIPFSENCPAPVELTKYQKRVSDLLVKCAFNESVFVDAVCGAGKTEICLPLIEQAMQKGLKIAWVIPRREVVLEIQGRLTSYYPEKNIVAVCEGHLDSLYGDIVVATAHQLYRYYQYFDLIVMDEPDAFPFRGNEVLYRLLKLASKGSIVYLSATYELDGIKNVTLPIRPSSVMLPVPKIVCTMFQVIILWKDIQKYRHEKCLIFVPTKKDALYLSLVLRCPYITSSSVNKKETIHQFRENGMRLVTTTVLERGVTFLDCYVFVYKACHRVFDEGSLVQIAGRAMRGMNPTKGSVTFYCTEHTKSIKKSCQRINQANSDAMDVLNS